MEIENLANSSAISQFTIYIYIHIRIRISSSLMQCVAFSNCYFVLNELCYWVSVCDKTVVYVVVAFDLDLQQFRLHNRKTLPIKAMKQKNTSKDLLPSINSEEQWILSFELPLVCYSFCLSVFLFLFLFLSVFLCLFNRNTQHLQTKANEKSIRAHQNRLNPYK